MLTVLKNLWLAWEKIWITPADMTPTSMGVAMLAITIFIIILLIDGFRGNKSVFF
jgi:hypothetical protein